MSKDSASRIESWVGEWPVVRPAFFWLAETVKLRLCVGLVGGYRWQKLESRRQAISMRRETGKPGLSEEGGSLRSTWAVTSSVSASATKLRISALEGQVGEGAESQRLGSGLGVTVLYIHTTDACSQNSKPRSQPDCE